MTRHLRGILASLAVVLLLFSAGSSVASALAVPPKPTAGPVVDQTNTLTTSELEALDKKIAAERNSTGNQIAVLMIPSLNGDILEEYSLDVARTWGVGQKERDSGVLLLVVKNDRMVRIEVGYGLEGALTDIRSNQIIRDRIAPEFKQGKYYSGIDSGIDGIIKSIHGEADPNLSPDVNLPERSGFEWPMLVFFGFTGLSWLGAILGRSKRVWPGGAIGAVTGVGLSFLPGLLIPGLVSIVPLAIFGLLMDMAVSSNYSGNTRAGRKPSWWAGGTGFGGGRSGGGGFGGFGGGGFGGGGASGRW